MNSFLIFDDLPHSKMVLIPKGEFIMGENEKRYDREKPEHHVTIKQPFWLGKYPVTQAFWKRIMNGENPSYDKGNDRPVTAISWNDIKDKFLPKLNQLTGKNFTLPSEAQWEYAARGEDTTRQLYAGSPNLKEVGWYRENSFRDIMPIGLKAPNGFGLHDMSGNVWEWCEDDWHDNYDNPNKPLDGSPWIDKPRASYRVLRGGSCFYGADDCRVSCRDSYSPDFRSISFGFRVALAVS